MEEAKDVKDEVFTFSSEFTDREFRANFSKSERPHQQAVATIPTLRRLSICSHHPTDTGLAVLQAAAAAIAAEMVALLLQRHLEKKKTM